MSRRSGMWSYHRKYSGRPTHSTMSLSQGIWTMVREKHVRKDVWFSVHNDTIMPEFISCESPSLVEKVEIWERIIAVVKVTAWHISFKLITLSIYMRMGGKNKKLKATTGNNRGKRTQVSRDSVAVHRHAVEEPPRRTASLWTRLSGASVQDVGGFASISHVNLATPPSLPVSHFGRQRRRSLDWRRRR